MEDESFSLFWLDQNLISRTLERQDGTNCLTFTTNPNEPCYEEGLLWLGLSIYGIHIEKHCLLIYGIHPNVGIIED